MTTYVLEWTLGTGGKFHLDFYTSGYGARDATFEAAVELRDGLVNNGSQNVRLTEKRTIELDVTI